MRAGAMSLLLVVVLVPAAALGQADTDSLLARDNGAFAIDLYRQLCQDDGNLIFSPYSVTSGLAMAYAGARGETAAEMAAALHFGLPPAELHAAMGRLERQLETIDLEPWYEFAVANALWGQEGLRYKDEFLALMESEYEASFHDVDFGRVEKTRRIINTWVEEKTEHRIQDLISPNALIPGTLLVLTNAIYFKGEWQAHFTVRMTQDEPFHLIGGTQVTVPLMRQVNIFPYADLDSVQVLELPYVGGDLTMLLALPKDVRGLPSLEQSLSGDLLDTWISELQRTEVQVLLPRFSITQAFNLNEVMQSLGMRKAFSLSADFSGMVGGLIYIYAILHKAFIDTDEHGTEAAAATSVHYMSEIRGVDPNRMSPVFRADHPFLFLIRHRPSGCILFMGRVLDPTR